MNRNTIGSLALVMVLSAPTAAPIAAPIWVQSGGYASVCERDQQKIDNYLISSGAQYQDHLSLWVIQLYGRVVEIHQRCAASDSSSANRVRMAQEAIQAVRSRCAQRRCEEWDPSSGAGDRQWFSAFESQVRQALSNPNYSADLGPVAGAVGPSGASVAVSNESAQREQCRAELEGLGREMTAANARVPSESTVGRMELVLWYTAEAIRVIDQLCPTSTTYRSVRATHVETQANVKRTCDQVATRPCGARKPN